MKIYFCDLCNESIPQEDLEKNRVTTVRGKMICAKCVPPAGSATPAAPGTPVVAARSSPLAAVVAVVALAAAGAAIYLALGAARRLDELPDPRSRLDDLARTCDALLDDHAKLGRRVESLSSALHRLEGEPAAIREALQEQLHRLEKEERDMLEVRTLLGQLRSDREVVERLELTQGRFEHELAELKSTLQAIGGRVADLGTLATAPADGEAADGAAEPGPAFDAETKKLLGELSSKDPSVRWSAVERLAKKHDARLVASFLPLLEDSDAFVQFRVIQALRELNARTSVGRLIKLLRDDDAIVREEAQDALVTLTGNSQRFDVAGGSPAEREKGVRAWEEWYAKNKERFEEPGV